MTIGSDHALRAPFPWYGGKRRVAPTVWRLLGNPGRYVEPFAGSLGVLLGRPGGGSGLEVVNDLDGHIVNVWRSLKHDPAGTIGWADDLRAEHDLTARHLYLVNEGRAVLAAGLPSDPDWHDPKVAGWWLYGVAMWIGTGWCRGDGPWTRAAITGTLGDDGRGVHRQLPHLGDDGQGVHRQLPHLGDDGRGVHRQLPHLGDDGQGVIHPGVYDLARALSDRLARVVVTSGDFARTLTDSALRAPSGPTGVFLDPPYDGYTKEYGAGDPGDTWQRVTAWCEANGRRADLRIVLCGYQGSWTAPAGWTELAYTASKTGQRAADERIWASPACLGERTLFGDAA